MIFSSCFDTGNKFILIILTLFYATKITFFLNILITNIIFIYIYYNFDNLSQTKSTQKYYQISKKIVNFYYNIQTKFNTYIYFNYDHLHTAVIINNDEER